MPDWKALQRAASTRGKEMHTKPKVAIPKSRSRDAVRRRALKNIEERGRSNPEYNKRFYKNKGDFGPRRITSKEMEKEPRGIWEHLSESGNDRFTRREFKAEKGRVRSQYLNEEARAKRRKKRSK